MMLPQVVPDLLIIFHWWALLFFLGLISIPSIVLLFHNFFDRGYAFAKVMGILLVSYFVWILGSLKILPFTYQTAWLAVGAVALFNLIILRFHKTRIRTVFFSSWKLWVFEELAFFITLTSWSFIRGFQPDIRGLEKFMDFGFVNSILRSNHFPPQDMWFSSGPINYYYFGHLVTAVLTKLSGIPSSITYNLMIATIFALVFTGAFSIGSNLYWLATTKKKHTLAIFLGLTTACILTVSSNLHPLYWLITHGNFVHYWYPDATRFIVKQFGASDNTIHEFPIYSFVVADLHGHLINLPFVLFFLGLVLSITNSGPTILKGVVASWVLGIFYMTNAWDLPIYSLVFSAVAFFFFWDRKGLLGGMVKAALWSIPIVAGSLFFSFPFQLAFKNISGGVGLTDFRSPPWMLLVLWGLPLITTTIFILSLIKHKKTTRDFFILSLILVSWFLIVLPEVIYIKDIYIHEYQRANTMFKFTYQAFVMFSLATPYILWKVASTSTRKKFASLLYLLPTSCLLALTISYSYFAVRSYYGLKNYSGLAGDTWVAKDFPGEYGAIQYLKKLPGRPVVLQAAGDSYTDFDVISSYTGLPTVQGWLVHEWLWRGSFDQPGKRAEDVEKIYVSDDQNLSYLLLVKYKVEYVVVGTLEKQKYNKLQEDKFGQIGTLAFSSAGTRVYKIN